MARDRLGDNLYANCLLALTPRPASGSGTSSSSGTIIWDRDPPSPPSLVTVHADGRAIDAVAQATKHGYVFVFDRVTGTPLFPIEYRKFPASTVPGEAGGRRRSRCRRSRSRSRASG